MGSPVDPRRLDRLGVKVEMPRGRMTGTTAWHVPGPSEAGLAVPARPRRGAISALSHAVAFGVAAPIYSFLTAHETWRASCRALGALVPGPRVLDLGIGPGTSALEMARGSGKLHLGLDRSAEMLRRAARAARAEGAHLPLLRADAMALPVIDGALDGVTGHSLLYLLPDPAAALAEVRRVLRPGGRVAFLEPRAGRPALRDAFAGGPRCGASMLLWRGMSRLHARFDEEGLVALLARAGLRGARAWPVLGGHGVMAMAERPE
jgi:SAM-dependent methyltransferase